MHTEYTLKVEFNTPSREALTTFIRACKDKAKELSVMAALMSGETPTVSLVVENNEVGTKTVKVFNGE